MSRLMAQNQEIDPCINGNLGMQKVFIISRESLDDSKSDVNTIGKSFKNTSPKVISR